MTNVNLATNNTSNNRSTSQLNPCEKRTPNISAAINVKRQEVSASNCKAKPAADDHQLLPTSNQTKRNHNTTIDVTLIHKTKRPTKTLKHYHNIVSKPSPTFNYGTLIESKKRRHDDITNTTNPIHQGINTSGHQMDATRLIRHKQNSLSDPHISNGQLDLQSIDKRRYAKIARHPETPRKEPQSHNNQTVNTTIPHHFSKHRPTSPPRTSPANKTTVEKYADDDDDDDDDDNDEIIITNEAMV